MSITLEELIRFHTEEAERMKLMKLDKRINKLILGSESYEGLLQEHEQMAKWLEELSRARALLKATHELLEAADESPYVLDALSIVVNYDDAECDGCCLKEDIEYYFDEYGEDGDAEMNMTLEDAIVHAEDTAKSAIGCECREEHRQLAEWLKILKKAKFEYDEAWRIITHPTPDVNYADKQRAQVILDTFKGSLGKLE